MNAEKKKLIIEDLNTKLGTEIADLSNIKDIENELTQKKDHLQSLVGLFNINCIN